MIPNLRNDLGATLRLDGEQENGRFIGGSRVIRRSAKARVFVSNGIEGRRRAPRSDELSGGQQFAVDHAADEGAADVTGPNDSNGVIV
jgi:hypothetical protein